MFFHPVEMRAPLLHYVGSDASLEQDLVGGFVLAAIIEPACLAVGLVDLAEFFSILEKLVPGCSGFRGFRVLKRLVLAQA